MVAGRLFGPYEIVRKLGRGMTDVYLAWDAGAARYAVLKVIEKSGDALTQSVLEAERRGAEIQRQLHEYDPRVVEIYGCGDLDDCFYVAMEYVEGRNVAELLAQDGRLEARYAAIIAREAAGQLDRLHSFRADIDGQPTAIVHGDIKPSNIQIATDGSVRLLDFGIAKAINLRHHLTHHSFGSPSYCSPERLSTARVDQHADLWALAVTLYEMAAGLPPYQAESTRKLESLIQSKRPPRALPNSCPKGLRAIVSKALAGDPAQRYPTAGALAHDLDMFLENRAPGAENEVRVSWRINATVESKDQRNGGPTAGPAPVPARVRPAIAALRVLSAAGCLLLGMAVFMAVGYSRQFWSASAPLRNAANYSARPVADIDSDLALYRRIESRWAFLGRYSPAPFLIEPLRAAYLAGAEDIIGGYRRNQDRSPLAVDWRKAQLCLEHALELGAGPDAAGGLELVRGYQFAQSGMSWKGSNREVVMHWRERARERFEKAAAMLPRSPDPHLALATIYAYLYVDLDRAVDHWDQAGKLGYQIGRREIEQEADAYRLRAKQEVAEALHWKGRSRPLVKKYLALARRDVAAANGLDEGVRQWR